MKRGFLCILLALIVGICLSSNALAADVIKIGFNIELTGDIPKVGEASKYAAEMLKEQINRAGGCCFGSFYPDAEDHQEKGDVKWAPFPSIPHLNKKSPVH